jgi:hypothetical protein
VSAQAARFEVQGINLSLNQQKSSIKFWLAVGLATPYILLAILSTTLLSGSAGPGRSTDLLIIVLMFAGFCALMTPVVFSRILTLRRGASQFFIDSTGFALTYPNGKVDRVNWVGGTTNFELIDCSGVNPEKLKIPSPYIVRIHGVESVIPVMAYDAVAQGARAHGMFDRVEVGGLWTYAADARPVIHHFSRPPVPRP